MLCDHFKMALETRVQMGVRLVSETMMSLKMLTSSSFDIFNIYHDGSAGCSFFNEQKDLLIKELELLENDILKGSLITTEKPMESRSGAQVSATPATSAATTMSDGQTGSLHDDRNQQKSEKSSAFLGTSMKIAPAWKPTIPLIRFDSSKVTSAVAKAKEPRTLATDVLELDHEQDSSPKNFKGTLEMEANLGMQLLHSATEDVVILGAGDANMGQFLRRHHSPEDKSRPGASAGLILNMSPYNPLPKRLRPREVTIPTSFNANEDYPLVFILSEHVYL